MKIFLNGNQIKYDTGKASLIKLPHSTKKFWLPDSLIWPARYGDHYVAYIPDDFTITSAKSGLTIDHGEIEAAFEKSGRRRYGS